MSIDVLMVPSYCAPLLPPLSSYTHLLASSFRFSSSLPPTASSLSERVAMNSPETPFQCLCPLGRGSSDDNRVGTVDHRFDDNHVDSSTNISFSGNTDIKSDNLQHSRSSTTRRTAPSHFYHGDSAQQCIDECRQGFLQYVLPSSPSTPSGSTSLTVTCSQLSQNTAAQQSLWQLYWCDSVFCGVWIDDSGTIGQDRKKK